MPTGGLTSTGFIAPTVQEIVDEINTSVLSTVDASLDLSPDQPIGQIIGILAEREAQRWEAWSTVYNAINPDSAEGNLLDNVSAMTGTRRRAATYSTVTCTLNINAGVTVPINSVVSVIGVPSNRWVATTSTTNSGGTAANFSVVFRSENTGPVSANAGTLTVINSPVVGWNSVTNAADAVLGHNEDTDAVLRVRRENELAASGGATIDAIRADVLQVTGILSCKVAENDTMVTDGDGLPAKSIHVIVWDGVSPAATDTDIAQAIWNSKPSGISTYGSTSATATDSQGNSRTVYFDRVTQVPIYFTLTVTPSITSGERTTIKTAIAAKFATAQDIGGDVIALLYRAAALESLTKLTDVPAFTLGTSPSPVGTSNITLGDTQIGTLSTTNILVNGS